jgi:hypothetical protein
MCKIFGVRFPCRFEYQLFSYSTALRSKDDSNQLLRKTKTAGVDLVRGVDGRLQPTTFPIARLDGRFGRKGERFCWRVNVSERDALSATYVKNRRLAQYFQHPFNERGVRFGLYSVVLLPLAADVNRRRDGCLYSKRARHSDNLCDLLWPVIQDHLLNRLVVRDISLRYVRTNSTNLLSASVFVASIDEP